MRNRFLLAALAVAACALTAVATALAAGSSKHATTRHSSAARRAAQYHGGGPAGPGGLPLRGPGGPGGGAVHSESVVLDKAGTGFITVTTDSGKVKAVSASEGKLTIEESANGIVYKTVTLEIASGAKVTLDGNSSSLEALKEGDRVVVCSSSEGTTVLAADSSFRPEGGFGHQGPPPGGPPSE